MLLNKHAKNLFAAIAAEAVGLFVGGEGDFLTAEREAAEIAEL
jgi:hypothetical protein